MKISYEKLWKLVIDNKMKRQDLARAAEISANTVTKLGKNEAVSLDVLSLSSFKAEVEVATSHVFYSWVFGFGGRVKIKGPESVKREYEEMVKAAAAGL